MDDVGTDVLMTKQWAQMRPRRLPSSKWFAKEGCALFSTSRIYGLIVVFEYFECSASKMPKYNSLKKVLSL